MQITMIVLIDADFSRAVGDGLTSLMKLIGTELSAVKPAPTTHFLASVIRVNLDVVV